MAVSIFANLLMLGLNWKLLQFNCNKSQLATAEIEGSFAGNQLDIALIQEPQLTDNPHMGCRVKKIPGTMTIQSSNSFKRPGARAAIYIRSDVAKAIKLIVLEQFSNRDIVTIQVELTQDDKPLKLIVSSIYCPRLDVDGNRINDPTMGKFGEAVAFANVNKIPILIGTDANAHNPTWGGDNARTDVRGIRLEEFCLLEGNLKILNARGEITYDRLGVNAASSSIDLTLCTYSLETCIKGWKSLDGFRGSDHKPIRFELMATKPAAGQTTVKTSTNWKNFATIVDRNLSALASVFLQANTKEGLDLAALTFTRVLGDAYTKCTRSRKITCNFKREWYSKELEHLKKKINRLQSKLKRALHSGDTELHQITLIEYKLERNSYKKLCSKQKFKKWKEMAASLEEIKDSARLQKILEKKFSSNLGTVRKPDGSYTTSIEETQEELMKTHLPGCIRLDDQTPHNTRSMTAAAIAELKDTSNNIWLQHQEQPAEENLADTDREIDNMTSVGNIEWAIASFKLNKAPGPDGITPNMLKKAGPSVLIPLSHMFANSAKLGYIPEEWSAAAVTFIPKPGKPSYDDTSSYRAISLMSFVLKTMEKLVDNKLRKTDELDKKLHKNQHAYREGRGTATALDEAATILENCLAKGGKAIAAYVDIKGAFDQTSYNVTISSLANLGVKSWTVRWIRGLLGDRKLQPANKDSLRRYRPAMGLPQGGCSSPLGWIVCANSLVTRLTDAGFEVIAYADDFKIIKTKMANEVDRLSSHICRALRIVSEWCSTNGLSVNPDKVGLMQFHKGSTRVKNMNNIVYEGIPIVPVDNFKFLGVYFDTKLNWKAHIGQALEKGRRATMIAAQYLRFSWGPSPKAAMLIMNQVVVPRVLYGCGIWWHKAQLVENAKKFDKLQRLMLRMAMGFFHTTPTADILRILEIESLSLRTKKLALDESLRLTEMGGRRPNESTKGHRNIDQLLESIADTRSNGDSIGRVWNTQRQYKVVVNAKTIWQEGLNQELFTDIWYSDGSKRDDAVGVGWCDHQGTTEKSIRLSGYATIMQAEMTGIRLCAEEMRANTAGKKVLILSDSQAALKALENPVIRSETTRRCANTMNILARCNDVTLGWIPGHSNHAGNENADKLANEGAAKDEVDLEIPEASSSRSGKITEWLKTERTAEWLRNRPDNGLFAKTLIEGPGKGKGKEIAGKKRSQVRARISILTGHSRSNKYLMRAKGEGDGLCRFCSTEYESVEHLIKDCYRLEHIRLDTLGSRNLDNDQLKTTKLENLIRFSKESGFYDMLACDIKT